MRRTRRKTSNADVELKRRSGTPRFEFRIRRARTGDLPEIVRMSRGVREIENYPGQQMKADDFRHFIAGRGAVMLVAVGSRGSGRKEEVAGYVTIYQSDNYLYLPYAVTRKEWRRHGVQSALLAEVERLAKEEKVEYILMSVYFYNSRVHTFLKERGYVPSKKLVQYSKTLSIKGKR